MLLPAICAKCPRTQAMQTNNKLQRVSQRSSLLNYVQQAKQKLKKKKKVVLKRRRGECRMRTLHFGFEQFCQ